MKLSVLPLYILAAALLAVGCSSKDKLPEPKSLEELEGLRVCVMEGSIEQDYAMKHLADKNIQFSFYPGISDCLLAVAQHKADVFFGADYQAYNQSFRDNNMAICLIVDEIYAPYAFGLEKSNVGLLNDINGFIDKLSGNGCLEEMRSRWFNIHNTDFHNCIRIAPIPADKKTTNEEHTLKVGISGVKQPAEVLINNAWTGFEIELLQMYAAERGLELQISVFDFSNLMPALQSKKIDVAAATLVITPERKGRINFTHSTNEMKACFIINGKKGDVSFAEKVKKSAYVSLVAEKRWKLILNGFWTTIKITIFSLILGTILGLGICQLKRRKNKFLRQFATTYIYIFRTIPTLVFLMLMFYVFLADTRLDAIQVAIVSFALCSAAFIAEILRTGIDSIDIGQTEAARGLGCTSYQCYRYIIIPQAIKTIVPVYKNECISLLKSTSVVGYISIADLTKASDLIRSSSFEAFFPLITITVIYFALAALMIWGLDALTKKQTVCLK